MQRKVCANPHCGEYVLTNGTKKYCSQKCRQRAYRDRQQSVGHRLLMAREIRCRNCGKIFYSNQPRAQFHSVSCRVSFHQQQKRLERKEVKS